MYGPWNEDKMVTAFNVPLLKVVTHISAYVREDASYAPEPSFQGSRRFDVNCYKRDIQLVFLGQQWLDCGAGADPEYRRGVGAISLVSYLAGVPFVRAVQICLDAHAAPDWEVKNSEIGDDRYRLIEEAEQGQDGDAPPRT